MTTKKKDQGKLTIIWDGQFGSTGKGQIAHHIQSQSPHDLGVRVGGPNAGHTFYFKNRKIVVQSIPVIGMMGAKALIGPAGYILENLLVEELKTGYEALGQPVDLQIDANAAVIGSHHMNAEAQGLKDRIGSTGEGVGAATADKVWRVPDITVGAHWETLAGKYGNEPWFAGVRVRELSQDAINIYLLNGYDVMLEGTQGYGLSLHTGGYYPYCTSRECTPQALIAETGTGVHNASSVESIMVIRTYPIRVGGNSGPLPGEISWEELSKRTGGYVSTPERTTVTKKVRRIAEFDMDLVQRAIRQCGPTGIALMFLDYKFPEVANATSKDQISKAARKWLLELEKSLGVRIKYLGTGPGTTVDWK